MIKNLLRRCIFLYAIVFVLVCIFVSQDKIIAKSLNYENGASAFVAEFAENQSNSFAAPRAEQALRYYRNLIRMMPDSAQVYGALAFCYYHYGNNRKAIRFYEKAVQKDPTFFGFYYNLGSIYSKIKMNDKAIEFLTKAVTISPNATINYPYVFIPDEMKQVKGDVHHQKILNLQNMYEKCHKLIIFSLWSKKDYVGMLEKAKERIDSGSMHKAEYLYYAGIALYELKQYQDAYHYLRQADVLNPQNRETYELLAKCFQQLNLSDASEKISMLIKNNSTLSAKGFLSLDQLLSSKLIYYVPIKPLKIDGKKVFIMI